MTAAAATPGEQRHPPLPTPCEPPTEGKIQAVATQRQPIAPEGDMLAKVLRCRYPVCQSINASGYGWDTPRLNEVIADLQAAPVASEGDSLLPASQPSEPPTPGTAQWCAKCGEGVVPGLCRRKDASEPPTGEPVAISDEQVQAIFRKNCQPEFAGNYEITPGQAIRIARALAGEPGDLLALQRFADSVMSDWPEGGDLDGFALQDIAVACGLLKPETVTAPCCEEGCGCAEAGAIGPTECFRVQPVLKRARRAAAAQSEA